jgi:tetratricopeptide (TPR) repeat protein
MLQSSDGDMTLGRRYALCVGIGIYTDLLNRNLRYAVADATTVAERLADPQRGNFAVTVLTEPFQTTKDALNDAVEDLLSAPDRQAEDLTVLYFSCHGDVNKEDNTFCLLPSNATLQADGMYEQRTVIDISDLARWFSGARTHNIVVLLDVCHSGGAGVALQHFKLNLDAGPNFFIIGAARQDQVTTESSPLRHGMFTHCLLRAFDQPPTKDGWLTISQIQDFVGDEIQWFAKDHPIQIQVSSVFVNPHLPLLRNPGYPELSPLPPLWNVPRQRNMFFTGRDDVLSQLESMLQSEQRTALTQPYAINGLGGIGKTQLALEYAYRHRQDYHAVLWGRADTREALISSFVSIASLLGLSQRDEEDQMVIVEAVKSWLADRPKWLLILDNADELPLVKEFIPPAFRGHLLLTTRAQEMGKLAHKLEVEVMRPEMGALLLLRRSGRLAPDAPLEKAPFEDILEAQELAQELGGLPLALDQAGAYIETTQRRLTDYRDRYRTRRAEILNKRGGLVDDHPEAVATTWSLSFKKVEQRSPAAADILRLCAFLAPDAIPEEIFTKGANELGPLLAPLIDAYQLDQAIAALRAYSLIARDPHTRMLTVHRLVQAVMQDAMPEQERNQWTQRAVATLNAIFPDVRNEAWGECERLISHVLLCANVTTDQADNQELAALLRKAAYYLYRRAQYELAEPLYQRALTISEQALGASHPKTADTLRALARLYHVQGQYDRAEPLYQRALAIYEQVLGAAHPKTALIVHDLTRLYQDQGQYDQVERFYQRALAIYEQVLGSEHPITDDTLHNLARLYQDQGQYEQAEQFYQRALAIREQTPGASHPDTAGTLHALAWLYQIQGHYKEAEPLYLRALALREQTLGSEHPQTADTLHDLARLYQDQGRFEQAEPLLKRPLAIHEQAFGPNSPDTVRTLSNVAYLYESQGKYEQAEPFLKRALAICERVLGPDHPDTIVTRKNYRVLLEKMKKSLRHIESFG